MSLIDKYSYRSKLRYMNASEKFMYAVLTLAICIISRSVTVALPVFVVNAVLIVGKGGLPLFRYIKLLLIPGVFLLTGTVALVINLSAVPLDAFAFAVGNRYITGSTEGIYRAGEICVISMAAVSCLYFLALNTVMTDLLGVLRKLKAPPLLIELMLLIYRFIFVLSETASAIRVSQNSRLGYRDFRTAVRSFGMLAASLFMLAIKKSGALYDAMESRGYNGELRVLSREYPLKPAEIACIILYEAVLLLIWLFL